VTRCQVLVYGVIVQLDWGGQLTCFPNKSGARSKLCYKKRAALATPRRTTTMDALELKPGYEMVFTVTDYCDGPRKGIANYQDKPHL
jgi:hypothetical protein